MYIYIYIYVIDHEIPFLLLPQLQGCYHPETMEDILSAGKWSRKFSKGFFVLFFFFLNETGENKIVKNDFNSEDFIPIFCLLYYIIR